MPITHHKRLRMECPLEPLQPPVTPAGCYWLPWQEHLIDSHAAVKYLSFTGLIDTTLFPNLGSLSGCRLIMRYIREAEGFCPAATWLLATSDGCVAGIQGVLEVDGGFGGIQNVAVLPGHRGKGYGTAAVLQALHGFRIAGASKACLEVTAQNDSAVRLYRRLGFRPYKTLFKAVAAGTSRER